MIQFLCWSCFTPLEAVESAVGQSGPCPTCGQQCTVPPKSQAREFPPDFDEGDAALIRWVQPYTMTAPERIVALRKSVRYIVEHNVPGDIVECGVWKGGSMMAVARTLLELEATRRLHLFDTFAGMTAPTEFDKDFQGKTAAEQLQREETRKSMSQIWAYSPLEEVKANLQSTGYDESQICYIPGKVEDTLPAQAPDLP